MDDRSTAISAAEVADDRAEIAAAVKVAKAFRDKLEAAGISYHKLLALEEARRDMNDLAHHILLGWENGEGFPRGSSRYTSTAAWCPPKTGRGPTGLIFRGLHHRRTDT